LSKSKKVQGALTAAALATLITFSASSAIAADNNRSPVSNDRGISVSAEQSEQKRSLVSPTSSKKKDRALRVEAEVKRSNKAIPPEARELTREYRGEVSGIKSKFKLEAVKVQQTFLAISENPAISEEELRSARDAKRAAMKALHSEMRAELKKLRTEYAELFKSLGLKTPKL
jgi:hypothetical protein